MADRLVSTMPRSRTEHLPRSPASLSSNSSRRVSLRSSVQSEKQHSPLSPPARLNRKRAASLAIIEGSHSPAISELSISSPKSDPANSVSHVCLCQPDPKIPRPRNAFILYRQHYQGQVIAQNPGLANPDISKIIGAQWREQPVEIQNEWKRLAEEEKLRHQRQYPFYRYQPRRANKANAARTANLHDDPYRCSKCNGRFISQPATPLTPFPPTPKGVATAQRGDRTLPALARLNEEQIEPERLLKIRSPEIPSSSRMSTSQQLHHRPPHLSDTSRRDDRDALQSPRAKRSRRDNLQSPYPSQSPAWANGPHSATICHPAYADRQVFARHSQTGRMEPPPAPTPHGIHLSQPNAPSHSRLDDLRLPPLQTQFGTAASGMTPTTAAQNNSSFIAARSIEAMVMSIPFLNKIKVISKIAPPLQPPGPTSPAIECRGPVIAVEGTDPKLIAEVGRYLESCLSKEDGILIRTWSGREKRKTTPERADGDVSMAGTTSRPNSPPEDPKEDKQSFILEYLDSIRAWHSKSAEITKFITTCPHPSKPFTPRHYMHTENQSRESSLTSGRLDSPQCSPTSTPKQLPFIEERKPALLPVALLPTGYSLTNADRAASRIPIDDAYAPVDHWQWMATLWRGIIGVDLTIYVNSGPRDDDERNVTPTLGGAGVDVRTDARAIVLQCQNGRVEEKMLRRAGFEVAEWVRGLGANGPK